MVARKKQKKVKLGPVGNRIWVVEKPIRRPKASSHVGKEFYSRMDFIYLQFYFLLMKGWHILFLF
jgi:hypothetical protein